MFKIPAIPKRKPGANGAPSSGPAAAGDRPRANVVPPPLLPHRPLPTRKTPSPSLQEIRRLYRQRPEMVGVAMRLTRQLVRMKPAHYTSPWLYFCHFEQLIDQQDRTGFPLEDHVKCELLLRGTAAICPVTTKVWKRIVARGRLPYRTLLEQMKTKYRDNRRMKAKKSRKCQLSANHQLAVSHFLPWRH